jgi:hypothetical protein
VREAQVEGAPVQRFGRVGEGVRESESESCELGIMGGRLPFKGAGEEDIAWPLRWSLLVVVWRLKAGGFFFEVGARLS